MRAAELAPSRERICTRPPSLGSIPAMMLSSVLLPQPDGPTMLAKLPRAISRLKDSITVNFPSPLGIGNILLSPSMVTACNAIGSSSCQHGPPGKHPFLPGPQDQHVDR